jgi:DNA/RNA endonuclease YhcR with UshA esterase domain
MSKLKYILILFLIAGIISCGNKDDESSYQNTEDNTEQISDKKEEPKEQPGDTSKEHQVSKTDTTASKELKFYSKTKPQAVISAIEAGEYIGKVVTVNGFVADVYKTDRVAYLNFVEKFPQNPFSGVIFANKFDVFGDLNIYEGKNVSLTGRVTVYKEKPQIILDSKEQVKILK